MKDFSSRKKAKSDSDVPLLGRLRASSAWSVFDIWCEGTASPKDSEAVARQRLSHQKIRHGVAGRGSVRRTCEVRLIADTEQAGFCHHETQRRNFRDDASL